jgi:phosphatidylserine/phosphatidylglycerophosphate/cardiolipin synthase-like enzyme
MLMKQRFESDGPRPIIVISIIILMLVVLGALFAAIRVFFLDAPDYGVVRETGSVDAVFCRTGDCESTMLSLFENATDIRCAYYELDLPRTIAVLDVKNAEVLVFEENAEESMGHGFSTVDSAGLMHHKFCVLDGSIVITGSMNPTVNAQTKNDEHLVVLRSRTLAAAYAREWDILDARGHGGGKKARVDAPLVELSGTPVDVCFAPAEGCEADLIAVLDNANVSIQFMTFSFTSDAVGDALVRAYDRGVAVEGIVERRQSDQWSEYDALKLVGIPVLKDGNSGTMHHKVFIIDGTTVVTGSYNPTANANTRNDENLLVIENAVLAAQYISEYGRVKGLAS